MPWHSGNFYLTTAEMQDNARMIERYAKSQRWRKIACAAILANMQAESGINPGIWENLQPYWRGYGLVQWTPYLKYSEWAIDNGYPQWEDNGPAELARLTYEADNNLQWFDNSELGITVPCTFNEFLKSNNYNLQDSTNYWLWFYEHPADPGPNTQAQRYGYAQTWLTFLNDWPDRYLAPWLLFKYQKNRRRRS